MHVGHYHYYRPRSQHNAVPTGRWGTGPDHATKLARSGRWAQQILLLDCESPAAPSFVVVVVVWSALLSSFLLPNPSNAPPKYSMMLLAAFDPLEVWLRCSFFFFDWGGCAAGYSRNYYDCTYVRHTSCIPHHILRV